MIKTHGQIAWEEYRKGTDLANHVRAEIIFSRYGAPAEWEQLRVDVKAMWHRIARAVLVHDDELAT